MPGFKPTPTTSSPDRVTHVSFGLLSLGIIVVLLIGMAGGFIADQFFGNPLPPLTGEGNQFVTTVQEVTISPNQATAGIVERSNKSVFLLARSVDSEPVATGFAITNDGMVVSTADINSQELIAIDSDGRALPITRVGQDEIYGLTYYRLASNVVVPLDLRQGDAPVGIQLIAMGRNRITLQPRILHFLIAEYAPPSSAPAAVQRIVRAAIASADILPGSPLIDEEGKVAAITQAAGTAYPVSYLQTSLARATNNQREVNPFESLGIATAFSFKPATLENAAAFQVTITAVTPDSPAQIAGLRRGDSITAVKETPVTWEQPIAAQLAAAFPLTLTVLRNQEQLTVTLNERPPQNSTP